MENHVWGVNSNDMIYYRNGVGDKNWTQVEPTDSRLKQVSVSGDGSQVWGVKSNNNIYYSTVSFTSDGKNIQES